jgi:hypothetical protein
LCAGLFSILDLLLPWAVFACHLHLSVFFKEVRAMCQCCCEHPEKLKGKAEECTPEQIRDCHGDVEKHPCKGEKKKGK